MHLKVTINSFSVDALYDPGSSRTLSRKDLVPKILESLRRYLDCSRRSSMNLANRSRDKILLVVQLPCSIDDITKEGDVRVATKIPSLFEVSMRNQTLIWCLLCVLKILRCRVRTDGQVHPLDTWVTSE